MKTLVGFTLGIMLIAGVMAGCQNAEPPVAPVVSGPATAQPVDQRIVGTWADAVTMDAIEFRSDGTWRPLYIYGMMVHDKPVSYYDTEPGGTFVTTPDGKCILSTTAVTFSSPTINVDTCTYAVASNSATLSLSGYHGMSQSTYARTAVGDMVR